MQRLVQCVQCHFEISPIISEFYGQRSCKNIKHQCYKLYNFIHVHENNGCLFLFLSGKTLLAKAVANQTSATFLRVVGSELIQKYLGDGPKLVRELFRVAEEHAPSIVFIDEIDAIGTKRYDAQVFSSE